MSVLCFAKQTHTGGEKKGLSDKFHPNYNLFLNLTVSEMKSLNRKSKKIMAQHRAWTPVSLETVL